MRIYIYIYIFASGLNYMYFEHMKKNFNSLFQLFKIIKAHGLYESIGIVIKFSKNIIFIIKSTI